MEDYAIKIKRSTFFIKISMVFVILTQAIDFYQTNIIDFYQTNIIDFGSIAMALGVLALLRGLLLSPFMFNTPVKVWFKNNVGFSTDSYKYFSLAFVLIVVGLIRYV